MKLERLRTHESVDTLRSSALGLGEGQQPTLPEQIPSLELQNAPGPSTRNAQQQLSLVSTEASQFTPSTALDAYDAEGRTPLYNAVVNNKLEMARTLITCTAGVDIRVGKQASYHLTSSLL